MKILLPLAGKGPICGTDHPLNLILRLRVSCVSQISSRTAGASQMGGGAVDALLDPLCAEGASTLLGGP